MAFLGVAKKIVLTQVASNGRTIKTPIAPEITSAARCGRGVLATRSFENTMSIVRLDGKGQVAETIVSDGMAGYPMCSADGRSLYYIVLSDKPGIRRCDGKECRQIVAGMVGAHTLSPDGSRVAYIRATNGGLSVQWVNADGTGQVHEVVETETGCTPAWSTSKDLWVAVRKGRKVIWSEIDTDSGKFTGRASPGSRNCADGEQDPSEPDRDAVHIEVGTRSRVRFVPTTVLTQRSMVGSLDGSR
jgi:hypothetical protein